MIGRAGTPRVRSVWAVRAAGRLGRGERARVAAQVRSLVSGAGVDGPAARTTPIRRVRDEPAVTPVVPPAVPSRAWLPGTDFERHVLVTRPAGPQSLGERLRWNPGRRGAAAIGLLVIVVVACAGWWLASAKPQELPVTSAGPAPAGSGSVASGGPPGSARSPGPSGSVPVSSAADTVSTSPAKLVIDVAGKVRRPGIYLLPPGSRVYDALRAAGGVRPGVSTVALNLAEPLRDGEQIVVGMPSGAGAQTGSPPPGDGGSSGPAGAAVVDLNTATLEQLESLPGVGPVLGQNILDYRAAHGAFTAIDQLQNVTGIGPAKFAAMKDQVSV